MKSHERGNEPACLLAHELVNKVSIIIGFCELLVSDPTGPKSAERLETIHNTAKGMAERINAHQCRLAAAIRKNVSGATKTSDLAKAM